MSTTGRPRPPRRTAPRDPAVEPGEQHQRGQGQPERRQQPEEGEVSRPGTSSPTPSSPGPPPPARPRSQQRQPQLAVRRARRSLAQRIVRRRPRPRRARGSAVRGGGTVVLVARHEPGEPARRRARSRPQTAHGTRVSRPRDSHQVVVRDAQPAQRPEPRGEHRLGDPALTAGPDRLERRAGRTCDLAASRHSGTGHVGLDARLRSRIEAPPA